MPEKILITGGGGFLGAHFVDYILRNTDMEILALVRYKWGQRGKDALSEIGAYDNDRVKLFAVDVTRPIGSYVVGQIGTPDYIVHLAAKTRIDGSITVPHEFVNTNVLGTLEMLEWAKKLPKLKQFLYFSSDDVFGPAPEGTKFKEWHRYNSANPYAATKAAAEELCLAWANTYGVPVIVTHCQNLIGERQPIEKFLPTVVRAAFKGATVKIYVDPETQKAGCRDYLHARDAASAVVFLLEKGQFRNKYNISANRPVSSAEVIHKAENILQAPIATETVKAIDVRPGFVVRYGLNGEKLLQMGWKPPKTFEQNLEETVTWMAKPENKHWLEL